MTLQHGIQLSNSKLAQSTCSPNVIASEATQSISPHALHAEGWIASSQGLLAMTLKHHRHGFAISRLDSPEVCHSVPALANGGRREDRMRAAPAVSCACCARNAHTSIQVQRRASGLPCARESMGIKTQTKQCVAVVVSMFVSRSAEGLNCCAKLPDGPGTKPNDD